MDGWTRGLEMLKIKHRLYLPDSYPLMFLMNDNEEGNVFVKQRDV